ncbi:histidine--tRNA ligase [Falsiporphyromonas endometrii]|uniref:Histidine--tRNA ligase n=1 Tax=Falsiporphyromonas endometrii TaxID=1387297 RepID=A0ABV9K8Q8_9PORP
MNKPSIPKGTRDFGPEEMAKRNYIFQTIRDVYALYGFSCIETPSMETLATLMGKYGEEGDRLLFKILDSGDFLSKMDREKLADMPSVTFAAKACEKGLRYDLTVPFARYVVMHRNEISFPFKRYQIQPVWRADRPQKGRYREFYQCDADIIGSDSLLNEVELLCIIDEVYRRFKIPVKILLNNRKILSGIAEAVGCADKIVDITVAIDKLDKIGLDKVFDELRGKGFTDEELSKLKPLLLIQGSNREKLSALKEQLACSEIGLKGVEELTFILDRLEHMHLQTELVLDISLARGLSYYTGAIVEVKATTVEMGSITGGGRYDNLTGIFGVDGLSGVGISFGADRIFDVLNQLDLFPEEVKTNTQILFVNFGEEFSDYVLGVMKKLRSEGIRCSYYTDTAKMKKQMSYANAMQIPYVALIGEDECRESMITIKNMHSGNQKTLPADQISRFMAGLIED